MLGGQPSDNGGKHLLFPWEDADGLTIGLRDALLWAAVFEAPRPRTLIKAAAKDVLHSKGVAINNGSQIGELTVKLMSSRKGRTALFHELRKLSSTPEAYVAERLHDELVRRKIAVPKTLYRWLGRKFFLDPEALEQAPDVFAGWTPENVLLAVAPFAILQRHETPRIVSLLGRDPELATLIESEGVGTATSAAAAQQGHSPVDDLQPEPALDDSRIDNIETSSDPLTTPTAATEGTAVTVLAQPIETPVVAVGDKRSGSMDERLVPLAGALHAVIGASQAAQSAFAVGDVDRGLSEGEKAKRARSLVQTEYARLRKREDVVAKDWGNEIPSAAFGDSTAGDSWLGELQISLQAHEEHRQAFVRSKRNNLCEEFVRLGLSPPGDLDGASTFEHVQAIRDREHETIVLETAWRTMLERRDPQSLAGLDAAKRLQLATRLLELRDFADLALLLFVADAHIRRTCPLERLVPLIHEQLKAGAQLPSQLWSALHERARDGLVLLLDAHGLTALLPDADEDLANADELRRVLLKLSPPLGHTLYLWTLEQRIRSLTPQKQIELLIEVASQSTDSLPVGFLIEALNAAGRSSEAALVASAAWRSGRTSEVAFAAVREAFLRSMIHACQYKARHSLLRNILMSPDELIRYEEGLITLLYVATHVEPALVDTIVYRASTTYEVAATKYTSLISEWLLTIRAGFMPPDVIKAKETELLRAQALYSEWLHELERRSTYTSWPYAHEYQRHIVDWLQRVFVALDRSGVLTADVEPDEFLDDIRDKHKLPRVEGQARKNMNAFIKAQHERLIVFAKIVRDHELQGTLARTLENPHRTMRSRLEFEASNSSGVIRDLYNIALREIAA